MNRQPILFCGILIFTQNYISQLILSNWFQRSFLHKTPFDVNHQNLFVKFKCDLSREWKLLNIQLILVIIVICFFLQNHITINSTIYFFFHFFEDFFLYVFIQNLLEAILYNQFPVNPLHRCVQKQRCVPALLVFAHSCNVYYTLCVGFFHINLSFWRTNRRSKW